MTSREKVKRAAACKKCFAGIGKDSKGVWVHIRHGRVNCNGQNGNVAQPR